tara:strand:- start:106 stop:267 length:162 start_codon:yes stop_codon:yes gene_type:complete
MKRYKVIGGKHRLLREDECIYVPSCSKHRIRKIIYDKYKRPVKEIGDDYIILD